MNQNHKLYITKNLISVKKNEKKIGRFEKIIFPEFDNFEANGKVDTGAFSMALHVDSLKLINDKLVFNLNNREFVYTKFKMVSVKNSFGKIQKRFSIFTKMKLGHKTYKFHVSLTDRKNMKFPLLIGRRFLYKFNYIVDVRKKNIYDTPQKV